MGLREPHPAMAICTAWRMLAGSGSDWPRRVALAGRDTAGGSHGWTFFALPPISAGRCLRRPASTCFCYSSKLRPGLLIYRGREPFLSTPPGVTTVYLRRARGSGGSGPGADVAEAIGV